MPLAASAADAIAFFQRRRPAGVVDARIDGLGRTGKEDVGLRYGHDLRHREKDHNGGDPSDPATHVRNPYLLYSAVEHRHIEVLNERATPQTMTCPRGRMIVSDQADQLQM